MNKFSAAIVAGIFGVAMSAGAMTAASAARMAPNTATTQAGMAKTDYKMPNHQHAAKTTHHAKSTHMSKHEHMAMQSKHAKMHNSKTMHHQTTHKPAASAART